MEIITIITLALSGLLLTFVGTMRLSNPIKTYSKNSGIQLNKDVNLLNEIRGISAVQLLAGILILLGTVVTQLTLLSLTVATLIFLGFLVGRSISIKADGQPNSLILQGIGFELVLGLANLFCWVKLFT